MRPSRTDEDAFVDLLDVLLRDGVVVEADVIVSVADIPLVGVKLRAAVAGMKTMTDYGVFESFDRHHRERAIDGDAPRELTSGSDPDLPDETISQDESAQEVGLAAARFDAATDITGGGDRSAEPSGNDADGEGRPEDKRSANGEQSANGEENAEDEGSDNAR